MANIKSFPTKNYEEKKRQIKKDIFSSSNKTNNDKKPLDTITEIQDIGLGNYQRNDHLSISDFFLNFERMNLPNIDLFSNRSTPTHFSEKYDEEKKYPQIIDLCEDDRLRISKLIEEIAKCRERNIQDTKMITDLQEEKIKMTVEISKLEKEITQLLTKNEEKGTEIIQLERKYYCTIQQQKMQYAELKLRMDVHVKRLEDELKEQQSKNKELVEKIEIEEATNQHLSIKYKNIRKKLKKAVLFIKKVAEKPNLHKETEDQYCQVNLVVTPTVSKTYLNKDSVLPEPITEKVNRVTITHSKSELSLLSDLFFKGPSSNDNNEMIVFLPQDSNLNCLNKYV